MTTRFFDRLITSRQVITPSRFDLIANHEQACNSLRNSLESLNGVDTKQDPKLKAILWKMLLDNLVRVHLEQHHDNIY